MAMVERRSSVHLHEQLDAKKSCKVQDSGRSLRRPSIRRRDHSESLFFGFSIAKYSEFDSKIS
eukprot:7384541-Prymnesium_polylepis.1